MPGRDGLVHISKLGNGQRVARVEDVLNIGDEVQVRVDDIDDRGKVSLSLIGPDGEVIKGSGGGSAGAQTDRGDRGPRPRSNDRGDRNDRPRSNDRGGRATAMIVVHEMIAVVATIVHVQTIVRGRMIEMAVMLRQMQSA